MPTEPTPPEPVGRRARAQALLLLPLAAAFLAATAAGATVVFQVNSTADLVDDGLLDGVCHTVAASCTLRAAVMQANVVVGEDVEIRMPAGLYPLSLPDGGAEDAGGDLDFLPPTAGSPRIALYGAGASTTIIDAGGTSGVLEVQAGRVASLARVTLRNGAAPAYLGGGLLNTGALTVFDSVIRDSSALNGGGVHNEGTLTLIRCEVRDNDALFSGGGLTNLSGLLTLIDTSVDGNVSGSNGGGAYFAGTEVDIVGSTFSNNLAMANGGGIRNDTLLFMTNSTLSANRSNQNGGGLSNSAGTVWTYNITIVGNEADTDRNYSGVGGGIYNSATVNLRNTVVAGNGLGQLVVYDDCWGAISTYGRTKFFTLPTECKLTQFGAGVPTYLGSLAEIGPLADHGGPTLTHPAVAPSGLIDGGEPIFGCVGKLGTALADDQRGAPRVAGVRCDIGAHEYGAVAPDLPLFRDGFETGGTGYWLP